MTRGRLARHRVRLLRRRPALWDELARRGAARRARPRLRHRPRVGAARAPRPPRHRRSTSSRRSWRRRRGARRRGRSTSTRWPRTPARSTSAAGSISSSPRCSSSSCSTVRRSAWRCSNAVAAHLRPGGLFAAALMDLEGEDVGDEYIPPGPDMRDVDGWVYSSQPVAVRLLDGGARDLARPRAHDRRTRRRAHE